MCACDISIHTHTHTERNIYIYKYRQSAYIQYGIHLHKSSINWLHEKHHQLKHLRHGAAATAEQSQQQRIGRRCCWQTRSRCVTHSLSLSLPPFPLYICPLFRLLLSCSHLCIDLPGAHTRTHVYLLPLRSQAIRERIKESRDDNP